MKDPRSLNPIKSPDGPATSFLHVRVTPTDKARWVKAAQLAKIKLAEWVIEKLNAAGGQ